MATETAQIIGSRNLSSEYEVSYSYDPKSLYDRALHEPTLDPPCRSTTFYDYDQSAVLYYGHRYYSPSLGRFINRDPIEEQGGINLYSFVGNNSINAWDYLGMDAFMTTYIGTGGKTIWNSKRNSKRDRLITIDVGIENPHVLKS